MSNLFDLSALRPAAAPRQKVIFPRERKPQLELAPGDRDRIVRINAGIRKACTELRQRHAVLRHQDALGFAALTFSAAGMALGAALFVAGAIPAWAAVVSGALFTSIAHEVEHDLIHGLYFARFPVVRHSMFALAWLLRPGTINPWVRRGLHLHHHKASGTETDMEERAITNGETYGLRRLAMMSDAMVSLVVQASRVRGHRARLFLFGLAGYFPLAWAHHAVLYVFLYAHAAAALGAHVGLSVMTLHVVDVLAITWVLPHTLRSFCLNFVSSSMHYYGDIQRGDVLRQTQVLDAWFLVPFQLFCFNFGSTHAIHHFVANEPFYVRQLTARAAHRVMRENGVRFNDLGTFARNNRHG